MVLFSYCLRKGFKNILKHVNVLSGNQNILGIDRAKAARFSFLMVVPLIFGKIAKDLLSSDFSASGIDPSAVVIGFVAAFLTGLFACRLMIKLVKRSKLVYFSVYCILIGLIGIFFSM